MLRLDEKNNIALVNTNNHNVNSIAKKIEHFFVVDNEDLQEALALFNFNDLAEVFDFIASFFNDQFDLDTLTRDQIEEIDFKLLAYSFANKMKLERPLIVDEFEKEKLISICGKIARLYIHEILFPELIKIDPKLAISIKNQIKRAVIAVAIIEDVDRRYALDLIKIEEVNIDIQSSLLIPNQIASNMVKPLPIYFKTILNEEEVLKLGKQLRKDYGIISSEEQFIGLINSNGRWNDSFMIRKKKEKWFIWLIDQMYPSVKEKRRKGLISLNKTKGYLQLLQGLLINEDEELFRRDFAKVCNEIRTKETKQHILIKQDIEDILKPFKTKYL